MESARARKLTTRLVGVGLALAGVCFLAGLVLAGLRPAALADGASVLPLVQLPAALGAGDPAAWLTLGVLGLLLTPSLRVVGMLLTFHAETDRRAQVSGLVVLVLLLAALATAT